MFSSTSLEVLEDVKYVPILVVGRISSFLSIVGSSCVIFIAIKDWRKKILHRLILGLSMADLVSSTALFFMPYSIPSYLGMAGAVGTHATCTLTGFFFLFAYQVGACYNSYLSIYYLLEVRRNWREHDFKKWMEVLGYSIAILIPFALTLASAATQSINPSRLINNVCMYTPYPWDCENDEDVDCTRSSLEVARALAVPSLALVLLFSLLGFVCTGLVCWTVQSAIRRSSQYRFQGGMDQSQIDRIRQVQIQAGLYSLVYFNTVIWPVLALALIEVKGAELQTLRFETPLYVFQLLFWAFSPLKGFLNFFVFTRLKAKRWRKARPDQSLLWIYKQILLSTAIIALSSVLSDPQGTSITHANKMGSSDKKGQPCAHALLQATKENSSALSHTCREQSERTGSSNIHEQDPEAEPQDSKSKCADCSNSESTI